MGITKITEVREWAEARINNISSITLNTQLCLIPEQQANIYDLPVATIITGNGTITFSGVNAHINLKILITVCSYDGDDYESDIENIIAEFEGSAFPDFAEAGDTYGSSGVTNKYSWETYPLPIGSPNTDTGIILSVITIDSDYHTISERT